MKLVVPESVAPDTEKKKHYKLRASIESDQQSLNPMDSGFLLKKHDNNDFNRTMPNLKDALEKELKQKDNKLMKTGTSINSDLDEVQYSNKQTLTWANTTFSEFSSLSKSVHTKQKVVLGKLPPNPKLCMSKMKPTLQVIPGLTKKITDEMYNVVLTDKENKHAKQFRNLSGIGMIEAVSINKGLGCQTLTDLVNWFIDSMASEVGLPHLRESIVWFTLFTVA